MNSSREALPVLRTIQKTTDVPGKAFMLDKITQSDFLRAERDLLRADSDLLRAGNDLFAQVQTKLCGHEP